MSVTSFHNTVFPCSALQNCILEYYALLKNFLSIFYDMPTRTLTSIYPSVDVQDFSMFSCTEGLQLQILRL